jgi:hypothetical protein
MSHGNLQGLGFVESWEASITRENCRHIKMKVLTVVSICTLLAVVQGRAFLEDGKREGPSFKIINSTASLELRKYDNATWAVAFGKSAWSIDLASFYAGKVSTACHSSILATLLGVSQWHTGWKGAC